MNIGNNEITRMYIGTDEVVSIYLGTEQVYGTAQPEPFPNGYTKKEYISQSSTLIRALAPNLWSVPYTVTASTDVIVVKMELDGNQSNVSRYIQMFGCEQCSQMRQDGGYGYNSHAKYYGRRNYTNNIQLVYDVPLVYTFANNTMTISGENYSQTLTLNNSYTYTANDFGIFNVNASDSNTYIAAGKIFDIAITDENGVMKYHYVPAVRNSDGKIGLYDLVADIFYTTDIYTLTTN